MTGLLGTSDSTLGNFYLGTIPSEEGPPPGDGTEEAYVDEFICIQAVDRLIAVQPLGRSVLVQGLDRFIRVDETR